MRPMGYNWAPKKMKKIFLFVVSLFCITMAVNAQDASGSCKLPGTYDYVNVDFYKGSSNGEGNIVLSNQTSTGQYITEIKVQVTAEILYDYEEEYKGTYTGGTPIYQKNKNKPLWKTVTLFNDKIRGISANETRRQTVSMPKYYDIRNIEVSVGNLICK